MLLEQAFCVVQGDERIRTAVSGQRIDLAVSIRAAFRVRSEAGE